MAVVTKSQFDNRVAYDIRVVASPDDRMPADRLKAALKVLKRRFNLQVVDLREVGRE